MIAFIRYLLTIPIVLAGAWLLGLLIFVAFVQIQEPSATISAEKPADGIVVLTGGQGRVAVGLQLLAEKKGKRLLISGVHVETNKQNLLPAQAAADKNNMRLLNCCTDLGYVADSTTGNAAEAAAWAQKHDMKSMIIVTSAYHLPRARLEAAQAMPAIELLYYPLDSKNVRLDETLNEPWAFPGTVELIATEYSKYLFAVGHRFARHLPL